MNFMEKITPAQKLELSLFIRETQRTSEEVKRAQGILLLTEGTADQVVYALTGLLRGTIVKLRKKYIKQGLFAIASKRKEKKTKDLLTKKQRAELSETLNTKAPRNYGWDIDYWTTAIVARLVLELYGVKYKSKTSIRIIFKQSKFTFHKPEKIYKRRNQQLIDDWKKENEAIVREALQDDQTVILTADEMILTSQTTTQKVWLPEGAQPKIECSNVRKRRSLYGFLSIKTGRQMAFKTERQTSEDSAKILKKVLSDNEYKNKKILLFWDGAPWHKGAAMRAFLDTCTNLRIIPFPPYAPEENPQEHVWKAGRANVTHNKFIPDIDVATRELLSYLNNVSST